MIVTKLAMKTGTEKKAVRSKESIKIPSGYFVFAVCCVLWLTVEGPAATYTNKQSFMAEQQSTV